MPTIRSFVVGAVLFVGFFVVCSIGLRKAHADPREGFVEFVMLVDGQPWCTAGSIREFAVHQDDKAVFSKLTNAGVCGVFKGDQNGYIALTCGQVVNDTTFMYPVRTTPPTEGDCTSSQWILAQADPE